MNRNSIIMTILVLFTLSIYTHAIADVAQVGRSEEVETTRRLQGRDFVRLGELETVTGILKPDRGEWFLHNEDGIYELHLGDHEHRAKTGIVMEEDKSATVSGFIYAQEGSDVIDIAVCRIIIDEEEFRFRKDDGTPLWRGRGARREHNK